MGKKLRILALDGGGVRGLLSSTVLSRIEREVEFIKHVDLFVGTSTGSLIAAALAMGLSTEECVEIYKKHSSFIFHDSLWEEVVHLRETFASKYSNENLRKLLTSFFGQATLGDCKKNVMITSFDVGSFSGAWKPRFFCSWMNSDRDLKLVDVLLSSTAAPVYFPLHNGLCDGGIAMNNPAMCGVTAALQHFGPEIQLDDIVLLSMGTGKNTHRLPQDAANAEWGLVQWVEHGRLLDILFDGVCEVTEWQCKTLLKHYLRVDPLLPSNYSLDDHQNLDVLESIAHSMNLQEELEWMRSIFLYMIEENSMQETGEYDDEKDYVFVSKVDVPGLGQVEGELSVIRAKSSKPGSCGTEVDLIEGRTVIRSSMGYCSIL